mmetsp:Transcript_10658/g.18077  ORF Transcript_10658/g.18077 Transcript_10658/m.18077 type:complete len:209 (+) Transcript_10658:86-712(+)|eukprot:CAMPEP_0184674892 /NCGR_PEP_ID=MMETSP0308-20130426/87493_1 /TAXON_ID=38269 /ORGANISM="Gloeochaete witrockiana, Strain SAG 46.84" /LENGTH=208 /DNA_ID=CAMNT_0027122551 /DNA_START=60 /DNA_END=686 /DNA_ORIENTATION=-
MTGFSLVPVLPSAAAKAIGEHISRYADYKRFVEEGLVKQKQIAAAKSAPKAPKKEAEKPKEEVKKPEPAPAAAKPAPAPAADDDDVDLFGEETEEEKAHMEKIKATADAHKASSTKKAVIAKSSLLIDIKPWEAETDMKALEEAVRKIEIEGLQWGASKLLPVAYGVKKLHIMATIIDDLVSTDDIEDKICAIEDYVQSMDVVAFNKI